MTVTIDGLEDVLRTIELKGTLNFVTNLAAPWGLEIPNTNPGMFHVITRGHAWLKFDNSEPIFMSSGDLVIFTQGIKHIISDNLESPVDTLENLLLAKQKSASLDEFIYGGQGEKMRLICGRFDFESDMTHPLFSILPSVLHIPGNQTSTVSKIERILGWINDEIRECGLGYNILIGKLTEVLFIQSIRSYVHTMKTVDGNWLAGLKNPQIGTALGLMHRYPEKSWSIQKFASSLGMSRTSFIDKFTRLVGKPPNTYLTHWRIFKSALMLKKNNLSITEISYRVGFQSESAFSKRFKTLTGISPRKYRKMNVEE